MTPIQLWLPEIFGGIARPEPRRDILRMFRARTREKMMWSVPGWQGPPNWTQEGMAVSCINGEALECVRILHIGANDAVVGPDAGVFPKASVKGLLDAWLNGKFVAGVPGNPGEQFRVKIPHLVNGGIGLVEAEMRLPGVQYFPFAEAGGDQVASAQWPPRADMPSTISPEMESEEQVVLARSLHLRLAWSAPFDRVQPLMISPDDLLANARMRLIAEDSHKDLEKAFAAAENDAGEWLSEGQATVNEAWLMPIIASEGEDGALFAIEGRFSVSAENLAEAYQNKGFRDQLSAPMSVTRAWGVPGLMWALLLDRLSHAQPYRACERCGRTISGRGHKRFCAATDDPGCYQARKAGDKRRNRARGR